MIHGVMFNLEHHPNGPRVRVLKQRIHHGAVGSLLTLLGVSLMVDDLHDWREWFKRGWQ
jgi:hypothetical protein